MEDKFQIEKIQDSSNVEFSCPNHGTIPQDDVIFICNKCHQEEMIFKNGMYICPACLIPGENFECMKCGSKKVTMKLKS